MHPQARVVLRRSDIIPHCLVRCSKTAGSLFFQKKGGKMVYGVPTSEIFFQKTTRFLKNSDAGTKLSDSGTNIFFFSHESSQFLMMDV
jgi:hypothetical protein